MPRGGESGERDPMRIYSRIVKLSQGRVEMGWEEDTDECSRWWHAGWGFDTAMPPTEKIINHVHQHLIIVAPSRIRFPMVGGSEHRAHL
jgi:hypothetical protein